MNEMMIPLSHDEKIPLYQQIYDHIRIEIMDGKIPQGEKLPSTRFLSSHLQVSRSTVELAYEQLVSEGYIEAQPYRGYYVSDVSDLLDLKENSQQPKEEEPKRAKNRMLETHIDFSPFAVDLEHFAFNAWRKVNKNLLSTDNADLLTAGDGAGEPEFREEICNYLYQSRGVICEPSQIIVGAGNEYLLMLLSQILGADRRVAMESPTYVQAYETFLNLGYQVCAVEMDAQGISMEQLRSEQADIAYVMPSHQYPTGAVMTIGRRAELLRWAEKEPDRYLIEDDYDSEFRYRGKPIPSLQSSDKRGKVIYIGTFSKAIAPAIRVSYMVLPESLLEVYRRDCSFYSCTVSRIDQRILNEFIRDGYFERHLNKMRMHYRAKHDLLLAELEPFKKAFTISGEDAGLHLLLTARGAVTEAQLLSAATEAGVKVYGMSENMVETDAPKATILLGFGSVSEPEMKEGLHRLQKAWL